MSVAARIVGNIGRAFSGAVQSDGDRRLTTPQAIAEALAARPTASGSSVTDETAMRVAAVYACVGVLSESVAMLPLEIQRRTSDGGYEPAPNHPMSMVLTKRPNRWQTAFDLRRMCMGHLLLRGNAYLLVTRSPRGAVLELIPLNPAHMEVSQRQTGEIAYGYTRRDGQRVLYQQRDIFHLRSMTVDGLTGLSVIDAAREAIGTAMSAEKHSGRMFSAGIQTTGVLKHPANLSAEAISRLADSFNSRYAGAENSFRPLILEEGMEWQAIGMTSEQSQFIEARKFQRNEIAMFFRVPPHMIGDIERGTSWGSGIEQQGLGFLTHTLMPWLVNIEQAHDAFLLEDFSGEYRTNFNTSELIRVDFTARQQGNEIMRRNGVISANEWRKSEGMRPRTDPAGDDYSSASSNSAAPKFTDSKNDQQPTEDQQSSGR